MCVNYVIFVRNKFEIFRIAFVCPSQLKHQVPDQLKFMPFYALRSIFTVRIYFDHLWLHESITWFQKYL